MKNSIVLETHRDIMSVYQQALLDGGLSKRLQGIRHEGVIVAMCPRDRANYFCMWADGALQEAKQAGAIDGYCLHDVLGLACIASAALVVEIGDI